MTCPPFFNVQKFALICAAIFLFLHPPVVLAQSPVSGFNPASLADRTERFMPTTHARAFAGSNALPAKYAIGGGMGGPFSPSADNFSLYTWHADLGATHKEWRVAGFYRGDQFYSENRDAIEFMRMINRRLALPEGRVFNIDYKTEGFRAGGLQLSRGFNLDRLLKGLTAGITTRYLYGDEIQQGTVRGQVVATGEHTYDFDLLIDYYYDKNEVYDRRDTQETDGDGYSFDIGLAYDLLEHFRLGFLARDLGGRIHWYDAPYTKAEAISQTRKLDDNGYQVFIPTLRGYEGQKDYTQRLPVKYDFDLSYDGPSFGVGATVNLVQNTALYWINTSYKPFRAASITLGYNINYEALSLGLRYRRLAVSGYLSDIYLNRTKAMGLMLSFY